MINFFYLWRWSSKCKYINLINFHNAKGKIATVTAVRPIPRFGALEIENDGSIFFEKDKVKEGWINGGFVFENIFSYLKNDLRLGKRPLETLSNEGNLSL